MRSPLTCAKRCVLISGLCMLRVVLSSPLPDTAKLVPWKKEALGAEFGGRIGSPRPSATEIGEKGSKQQGSLRLLELWNRALEAVVRSATFLPKWPDTQIGVSIYQGLKNGLTTTDGG